MAGLDQLAHHERGPGCSALPAQHSRRRTRDGRHRAGERPVQRNGPHAALGARFCSGYVCFSGLGGRRVSEHRRLWPENARAAHLHRQCPPGAALDQRRGHPTLARAGARRIRAGGLVRADTLARPVRRRDRVRAAKALGCNRRNARAARGQRRVFGCNVCTAVRPHSGPWPRTGGRRDRFERLGRAFGSPPDRCGAEKHWLPQVLGWLDDRVSAGVAELLASGAAFAAHGLLRGVELGHCHLPCWLVHHGQRRGSSAAAAHPRGAGLAIRHPQRILCVLLRDWPRDGHGGGERPWRDAACAGKARGSVWRGHLFGHYVCCVRHAGRFARCVELDHRGYARGRLRRCGVGR
mmetsp:Transcript_51709/g.143174  ORF Transcript_51709/g.143174 Transcript_51709/m.143174 type:complete len:351 (-) Transcript_51709:597-1649(-)